MDVVVENLTKCFGPQKAVDSVSFKAKKREILGFLGPNGAGKTTTMKIMACFLFPDYGNIRFGDLSIHKHARKIKQLIGYLPEHNPLYEAMNVMDFLTFIARLHHIPNYKMASRINDMIRIFSLENEKHKTVKELSKGYRQRLGLAQALIHDPKVLILDEPTTGLDPNQIIEIRELIKEIGQEKTVIISSHILGELSKIATRYGIIQHGRMVEQITAEELEQKCADYLHLRADQPQKAAALLERELHMTRWEMRPEGEIRIYEAVDARAVGQTLAQAGLAVEEMGLHRQDLEGYFLERMEGSDHV